MERTNIDDLDYEKVNYYTPTEEEVQNFLDKEKLCLLRLEDYNKLKKLGFVDSNESRSYNVGNSDYTQHFIQPWSIWIDYNLNPFDADIVKRVLRTKEGTPRIEDYQKIIHICNERIRQLKNS